MRIQISPVWYHMLLAPSGLLLQEDNKNFNVNRAMIHRRAWQLSFAIHITTKPGREHFLDASTASHITTCGSVCLSVVFFQTAEITLANNPPQTTSNQIWLISLCDSIFDHSFRRISVFSREQATL